jgi:hypothetical protein
LDDRTGGEPARWPVLKAGDGMARFGAFDGGSMTIRQIWRGFALAWGLIGLGAGPALAHCDGLDGPVVRAAEKALDSRNINVVLIWVRPEDEKEVRAAFEQTLAVRPLGTQAKALADRYFFETVVRLHRTGEGAAYTGLKPAGRDVGPIIPAADRAVETGSADALIKMVLGHADRELRAHFAEVNRTKSFKVDDVVAGRDYVKAYVEFLHYVERLHDAIATAAHGHGK